MVQLNLAKYDTPLEFHDYCQEYLCDVHKVLANKKLNWKTPLEISEGNTPDISKFHFHFYEPIWYYDAKIKSPNYRLLKGHFRGFADTSGDALTYKILTKKRANVM